MEQQTKGADGVVVREAVAHDRPAWDAYLDRFPTLPPLNRYAWRDVLEESYGAETVVLIACDSQGAVIGVCPAYRPHVHGGSFYTLRQGIVADTADTAIQLFRELDARSRASGARLALASFGAPRDIQTIPPLTARKTMVLPITHTEGDMWNALRSETRNRIRKAQRVLTVESGFTHLPSFYGVYARSMVRKGVAIHSRVFFERVAAHFGDSAELLVVRRGLQVIGGMLLLFTRSTATYPYIASEQAAQQDAPAHLLLWAAAQRCIARGVHALDMGESVAGGGTYVFKERFGGRPTDVSYYVATDRGGAGDPFHRLHGLLVHATRYAPYWIQRRIAVAARRRGRLV